MSTSSVLANPCPRRWEELSGDDRRRACADCGKDVLAVSELSLEEARAASKTGACLSFLELPGGLVRTREGWRLWRVAAVATALAACEGEPPPPVAPVAPVAPAPTAVPNATTQPEALMGAPVHPPRFKEEPEVEAHRGDPAPHLRPRHNGPH